jgi:hypothetical protein
VSKTPGRHLSSERARALALARPPRFTQKQIETALMALIAVTGNAEVAARNIASEEDFTVRAETLRKWKLKYSIRYDELREQYAAQMEASLAHEFRDRAMEATQAVRLAMEKSTERLESGEDHDPARSAANLSKVAQSSVDKLMTLTQRPQTITENRNIGEIVRSLAAIGVIHIPEATTVEELDESVSGDGE